MINICPFNIVSNSNIMGAKMNLLIDKDKLELLLKEYKDDIGNTKWKEQVGAFLTALFTLAATDFKNLFGINKKFIYICYVIYTIKLMIGCVKSMCKNYKGGISADKLMNDIILLDEQMTSNHTIIMIKDTYNCYSNKYLLYYDTKWKCKLFLNIKTDADKKKNEKKIIDFVSNSLHIEKDKISLEYKIEHINTKYSRSDKINKRYRHAFYEVKISKFTDELKKQKFSVDGTRYQWMTLDQMWNDKAIKDCNTDIVGYVRDIYQ